MRRKKDGTYLRWVCYPVLIANQKEWRYGLFEVRFVQGAPADAQMARVVGYDDDLKEYPAAKRAFARACELPTLRCTNAIDLQDGPEWDGRLIFDHLPVL